MSWVLDSILKAGWQTCPPCCVYALGTGNDLARSFHLSSLSVLLTFSYLIYVVSFLSRFLALGECGQTFVFRLSCFVELSLDRWVFQSSQEKTFFNYFSFGVDAAVVNRLQQIRSLYPFLFHFPSINNLWYVWCIILEALFPMNANLDRLALKADDEELSVSQYRSVVCLNIPYYCGGGLPLGDHYDLSQCCDQEIEIVAFSGIIHILAAKVGLKKQLHL